MEKEERCGVFTVKEKKKGGKWKGIGDLKWGTEEVRRRLEEARWSDRRKGGKKSEIKGRGEYGGCGKTGETDLETKRGRGDGLARWIDGSRRLECDGLLGNRSKVVKGRCGVYGFVLTE